MTRSYCRPRICSIVLEIEPWVSALVTAPRHSRWLVVIPPFTAGCQVAISWKYSSTTQSNSMPGLASWASLRAGSAWIKSPSDVSLMSRTLGIALREQAFQKGAEAVAPEVVVPRLLGGDVVQLDRAALAVEGLVPVPAVGRDLEDQAAPGVGGDLRGVPSEVVVVVEQPQPPLRRAPAAVEVQQHGDELGFGVGVDAAVLRPGAAADREHRRAVLQVHAEALADQLAQLGAVHLVHELAEDPRVGDRLGRKAAALGHVGEAGDHFRQDLRPDEVVDD